MSEHLAQLVNSICIKHDGHHDVGGLPNHQLQNFGKIDIIDKPLQLWEQQMHALLVVLASHKPPYITTDELRRVVESLETKSYLSWGYYEKWASAYTTILLERGVITQVELDEALAGDEAIEFLNGELPVTFREGDVVQVKPEDTRLRWRRPHLRCPGYIFGLVGKVERFIGVFEDPFALAFRGKAPKQPLYTVTFPMHAIWSTPREHLDALTATDTDRYFEGDLIEAEVYQEWLQPFKFEGTGARSKQTVALDESDHIAATFSHDSSHNLVYHDLTHSHDVEDYLNKDPAMSLIRSHDYEEGNLTSSPADRNDNQLNSSMMSIVANASHSHDSNDTPSHDHSHELKSSDNLNAFASDGHNHQHSSHDQCESDQHDRSHSHDHGHEHTHENRRSVEEKAHQLEGHSDSPGKVIGLALLKLLYKKGITNPVQIAKTVETLENAGRSLLGADLVARAWKDPVFKENLLRNAREVGEEIGIATSNPNAPTVLRVVENRAGVHNLIVCTLCSCYPSSLLGLSPSWYKSRNYRARAIKEPRKVLEEFGLHLPQSTKIIVHDSTADCRYLVLPMPPSHLTSEDIARLSIEDLKAYVSRDSMIGVAIL